MNTHKNIYFALVIFIFSLMTSAKPSGIEEMLERTHQLIRQVPMDVGCEYLPNQTYVIKIGSYACVKNPVICNATLKCAYSKNNIITEYEEKANCATDSNGKCPAKADDCRKDQKVHEIYRGTNAISNASSSSNTSTPQSVNTQSGIK